MRPAVTFALVAYNQEEYVREAIEGAFAQAFEPLEIILSDDCSSDRTFAIMQEMAANYRGPHKVTARQERPNVGTVRHLMNVARLGQGELMVVAAGDDISYPARSAQLYSAWKETGAAALASWHDEIDERGEVLRRDVNFPPSAEGQRVFRDQPSAYGPNEPFEAVPGFSAAYPRRFWADLPDPPSNLLIEDGIAGAIILLRKQRTHRVAKSLIAYRLLDDSMSNRRGGMDRDEIVARERKIDRLAKETVGMIDYVIDQARIEGIPIVPSTKSHLLRQRNHAELISGFWQEGPAKRFARLAKARMADDAKFILPRLLGLRFFSAIRTRLERHRLSGEA